MRNFFVKYLRNEAAFIFNASLWVVCLISPTITKAQETLQSVTNNGAKTTNPILLESDSIGLSIVSPSRGAARNVIRIGNAATSGTGGYIQGTVSNVNGGYGIWINQNAYYNYNKAGYIQPRGDLGSYLYTVNYHKGFAWYFAAPNGTDGDTIVPLEVASLTRNGTFTASNMTIKASLNLGNTTNAEKNGIIFKNGVRFISDFNYGNNGTVTTVGENTFVGINAGNFTMGSSATSASQASYNTGIGAAVLNRNTTGYHNTAMGCAALEYNTTGINNTASGYAALCYNSTGKYNTGYGQEALYHNSSGIANTANGYTALFSNITGNNNTAGGYEALYNNTTGGNNAANGYEALFKNTSGGYNTAMGNEALFYNATGNYNTANGSNAGRYIANGSSANSGSNSCVFIGTNTRSLTAADNNEIVIGYNAVGAGSNTVVLGNIAVNKTLLQGNVLIGRTSQTNTSYKLDVNGNIRANKVVVNTSGADYVFDSTYRLPSINALSNYIKTHHHLSGFPSAGEMQKNGTDLGGTQTALLKKVEELTLYVISLQNQITTLENKLQNQDHLKKIVHQ